MCDKASRYSSYDTPSLHQHHYAVCCKTRVCAIALDSHGILLLHLRKMNFYVVVLKKMHYSLRQ